jgi:hypothetical protein
MLKIGLGLGSTYFSAVSSGGSSSAGTYEVTVQPFENGAYYDVGGNDNVAYYMAISKTPTVRWMFVMSSPGSGFPGFDYTDYTDYSVISIDPAWTAIQVATAMYNAAVTAGFNVTRNGAILTFTASQVGNLADALGSPNPTITNGTP